MAKTVAIIQSRQWSTRLSGKAMVKIGEMTALGMVVKRLLAVNILHAGLLDEIIVATTTNPIDNLIESWCAEHKITCFRGSEHDVLGRYYQCAKTHEADWILRITADCPLLDPVLIYGLLTKQPRKGYQALAMNLGGIPDGYDAELFSFAELERAERKSKAPNEREHVSLKMRKANEDSLDYGLPFDYKGLRLSLDNEDDLRRIREYARYL